MLPFLFSCRSQVDFHAVEKNIIPSSPEGVYTFNEPSVYEATSEDSFTISMTYTSGLNEIESQFLKLKSTGDSSCSFEVDDLYSSSPHITLSACTGNGRVYLEYGDRNSYEVLINNDGGPVFSGGWDIYIMKDGLHALVVDSDRLFKVNLGTGVRTIIHSNSVGSGGADIGGMTSIQVNPAEDTVYAVDASNNTIVKIDIASGHGEVVSSSAIGSGQNFLNPTRLLVTADESTAYVADRNTHTFIVVDIATGNRTELSPYVGICYGMAFGPDEDSFYYIERDSDVLFRVNISDDSKTNIAENLPGDEVDFATAHALVLDPVNPDNIYVLSPGGADQVQKVSISTGEKSIISADGFRGEGLPILESLGMDISSDGKTLYVIDTSSSYEAIFKVDIATGNRSFVSK